jgi:hypothetical protein
MSFDIANHQIGNLDSGGKISKTTHKEYKSGKAKVDARLLLDTIAYKLSEAYTFNDIRYNQATFGDVLAARRTGNYAPKPANTISNIEDFYTSQEWNYLLGLHKYTTGTLHGLLPQDEQGNLLLFLPHGFCNSQ